mmetsp:Transcript_9641/g.13651  ORF Transcript_9641/g.13651 Transcript_9641/m.13651 type:complete len:139 (+) Transcript_9641:193-609(+)|eukprot:CAMPEP_0184857784 /NCGR_PEP_ID=MMETSP0580-20130426/2934_1 /TAXON_ID=1118495 /ORGANISM="Dactyliosolen fragilissimus" /LENGTH=138 /DNA_ID=CAMNT_0027353577 /DNA_START=89 /DNA_END=505 /DNA_ORIENTATION=+
MKSATSILVILLRLSEAMVEAWIQPKGKGGLQRDVFLRLHTHDDDRIELFRSQLENSQVSNNEDLFFGSYWDTDNGEYGQDLMELPTGPYSEWIDNNMCYADECEQCEIPEDFKIPQPKMDVLEFLGIKRAAPLKRSN